MASTLSKKRDYKYMAEKYSKHNQFQIVLGKQLVAMAEIKNGDKVLDIGCGTGEITAFIADVVGKEGWCVAVDPDEYRIQVATQKYAHDRKNICFITGDISSKFPHRNEPFYDIIFCSSVIHWLNNEEKISLFTVAYKCLKPGGKLAILSAEKNPEVVLRVPELLLDEAIHCNRSPLTPIKKSEAEAMLQQARFVIGSSELFHYEYTFPSLDCFLTWCCASFYVDESKILPRKKNQFAKMFVEDDGTMNVNWEMAMYRVIARKTDNRS